MALIVGNLSLMILPCDAGAVPLEASTYCTSPRFYNSYEQDGCRKYKQLRTEGITKSAAETKCVNTELILHMAPHSYYNGCRKARSYDRSWCQSEFKIDPPLLKKYSSKNLYFCYLVTNWVDMFCCENGPERLVNIGGLFLYHNESISIPGISNIYMEGVDFHFCQSAPKYCLLRRCKHTRKMVRLSLLNPRRNKVYLSVLHMLTPEKIKEWRQGWLPEPKFTSRSIKGCGVGTINWTCNRCLFHERG